MIPCRACCSLSADRKVPTPVCGGGHPGIGDGITTAERCGSDSVIVITDGTSSTDSRGGIWDPDLDARLQETNDEIWDPDAWFFSLGRPTHSPRVSDQEYV